MSAAYRDGDAVPAGAHAPDVGPARRRLRRHLIEWAVMIAVALAITLGVRGYVVQTFLVPSSSMEPTLLVGDRILVDKLAVDWGEINRGDVVVFHSPPNEDCAGGHEAILVKRVIGLPGDHLYSIGDTIYVDGRPLKEAWPHTEPLGPPAVASPRHPYVVGADRYFVMGDNHASSCDSRYWGTISRGAIIGKVFLRVWPVSRFGFL